MYKCIIIIIIIIIIRRRRRRIIIRIIRIIIITNYTQIETLLHTYAYIYIYIYTYTHTELHICIHTYYMHTHRNPPTGAIIGAKVQPLSGDGKEKAKGVSPLVPSLGTGTLVDGMEPSSYLVEPASSHMLVSKIKSCMCKYILIHIHSFRKGRGLHKGPGKEHFLPSALCKSPCPSQQSRKSLYSSSDLHKDTYPSPDLCEGHGNLLAPP